MNNTGKRLIYFIYIPVITVFFIYYLFPSDTAKKYIECRIDGISPDLNVTIDHVKPVFPPGLRFYDTTVEYINDSLFNVKELSIMPGLLSFLGRDKTYSFKGKAYAGVLEGRVDILEDKSIVFETDLAGINLEDITFIRKRDGPKISGILGGSIEFNGNASGGALNVKLNASDCEVRLSIPVFTLKSIHINGFDADIKIDGRKLVVKHCAIKGKEIGGSFSGFVIIKEPFGKSVLKLAGTIKPHNSFLANQGLGFASNLFFSKRHGAQKGFPVRLRGTIDKPIFSL